MAVSGVHAGWWALAQKVLGWMVTGGIVAGVDQAVDSSRSREMVVYQPPSQPAPQNLDDAVYVIIVSGTLGGVSVILIVILLLYICKISKHPAGTPESVEMRNMA
ncbi:unnamed protein product [Orchesella dallaii]